MNENKENLDDCTENKAKLKQALRLSLDYYSNVHRGSGQNSLTATHLYEKARQIVLDYFDLSCRNYEVIFCTPHRAKTLKNLLKPSTYKTIASSELGLPLGIVAMAVKKSCLPKHVPFETGGGTVKVVSEDHVLWANAPDKFEAGTPAIINVILLAKALILSTKWGMKEFSVTKKIYSSIEKLFSTPDYDKLSGAKLLSRIKSSLLGKELLVPTEEGDRRYINLDNGASTPTFEPVHRVAENILDVSPDRYPEIVNYCKKTLMSFLGAPIQKYDLIFTSNTTEAINMVAMNLASSHQETIEPVIVNSLMEHNSNELPWRYIPNSSQIRLGVDCEGFIDLGELEKVLIDYNQKKVRGHKRIILVAVSGASNVLGSFNDLPAIGRLAHRYGADFLVDAAQLIAHRKVNVRATGIDYLAFSGHKSYAPFGSGGLIVRKELIKLPEDQLKEFAISGEENVLGIAALTKMVLLFQKIGMDIIVEDEHKLAMKLINSLSTIPQFTVYGVCSDSSSHIHEKGAVVAISCNTIPFNLFANRLAERGGIGVRSGCFCAHLLGKHLLGIKGLKEGLYDIGFHVLPHFTKNLIPGLVRISAGLENTTSDIDHLMDVIKRILAEPRTPLQRQLASTHNGTPFIPTSPINNKIEKHVSRIVERVYST